jgi:hypothetical protein
MHPNKEKYGFNRMFPEKAYVSAVKKTDLEKKTLSNPRYTELLMDYLKCTTLFLND